MLKAHARKKHPKARIEVLSLYPGKHPATLTRGNIVYISNTAPKLITNQDKVYLLVIDNALLMAMLCARISDRMNRLFTRSKRKWFLLEYDPRSKSFNEWFLP